MAHTEQVKINGIMTTARVFDQPAQAIDDAVSRALPGGAIDQRVSMLCNTNLLDNWYFGNPVDQRQGYVVPPDTSYYANDTGALVGTTDKYYTVGSRVSDKAYFAKDGAVYNVPISAVVRGYTGAGYGIDRWKSYSNLSVIIEPDGITIRNDTDDTGYFGQTAEYDLWDALIGKTVTMSVLNGNGTLYFCTGTYGTNISFPVGDGVNAYMWPTSKEPFDFSIAAGVSIKVSAVKLELGSQQTLAHQDENGNWVLNEIPDYGEQLRRCQRMLIPIIQFDRYRASYILPDSIDFVIPVTNTMRAFPALIGNGLCLYTITGDKIAGFAFSVAVKGTGGIMVRAVKANHGMSDATLYVENTVLLSAEL